MNLQRFPRHPLTFGPTPPDARPLQRLDACDSIDNGSMPLTVLEKIVDEWIARGGGANKP